MYTSHVSMSLRTHSLIKYFENVKIAIEYMRKNSRNSEEIEAVYIRREIGVASSHKRNSSEIPSNKPKSDWIYHPSIYLEPNGSPLGSKPTGKKQTQPDFGPNPKRSRKDSSVCKGI